MTMLDFILRRKQEPQNVVRNAVPDGYVFTGLNDPLLLDFMRGGSGAGDPLTNTTVLRCVSLICESMGMLPINMMFDTKEKSPATEHPVYRLLKLKPNPWQTPYEFKAYMQLQLLQKGAAYAHIIRDVDVPRMLIPLDSDAVEPKLTNDYRMQYKYTSPKGRVSNFTDRDILAVRDLSIDGVTGIKRMRLAAAAIALAQAAEMSAANVFKTGNMAGGAIEFPAPLTDVAYQRLKNSQDGEFSGSAGAKKLMILEEGGKLNTSTTSTDAQQIENRNHQIAEIARVFGVPRPLLMMDETSWGSGIQQLGIFFIQYGLQHWFTAWEQSIVRDLMTEREQKKYIVKYNEHALLRGTLDEQAAYFSKALGAGGSQPWMTGNEVRSALDMPAIKDPEADKLRNPMTQPATPPKDKPNEPAKPAKS